MANFLSYYKKNNPNIYSLIVSVLLAIWYNGIAGLLNYYWPNRGPTISILFLIIPLIIFLTEDGHLDELYRPSTDSNAAVIVSSTDGSQATRRERFIPQVPVQYMANYK